MGGVINLHSRPKFIIRVNIANQYDSLLVLKLQVEAQWSWRSAAPKQKCIHFVYLYTYEAIVL